MGLGQLTPSFLMDLQTNMSILSEQEYSRLNDPRVQWQSLLTMDAPPSQSAKQRLMWLLDTAKIEYVSKLGGEVEFDTIVMRDFEIEAKAATAALKLNRFQLDDTDGGGVQIAAEWARQQGAYAAYWRQKQVAVALRNGGAATSKAYDGLPFFSNAHPVNPYDTTVGNYSNDIVHPIDDSVTLDVAFQNFNAALTHIRNFKMPNGSDPRFLRPKAVLAPPALSMRMQQLTDAKFIAMAAATGGGSADVSGVIRAWGIGQPVIADELAAAFGGSDTTYYIVAEQIGSSQLGALAYWEREPFQIIYNEQMTDAQLARMNELQWLVRGRNVVTYGHPFLVIRVKAA